MRGWRSSPPVSYVVGSINNTDLVGLRGAACRPAVRTLFRRASFPQFCRRQGGPNQGGGPRAPCRSAPLRFYGAVGGTMPYGTRGARGSPGAGGGWQPAVLLTLPRASFGCSRSLWSTLTGENQIVVAPRRPICSFGAERVAPPPRAAIGGCCCLQKRDRSRDPPSPCARGVARGGAPRVIWKPGTGSGPPCPPPDVLAAAEYVLVNELELASLRAERQPTAGPQEIAAAARALVGGGRDGAQPDRYPGSGRLPVGTPRGRRNRRGAPAAGIAGHPGGYRRCRRLLLRRILQPHWPAGAATEAALLRATAAAALSVEHAGAQPSMPGRAAIDAAVERLAPPNRGE